MKLRILTIVQNGMPWLPLQCEQFENLNVDWEWHIVHGPAANTGSTAWCGENMAGLSTDGTTAFLQAINLVFDSVKVYEQDWWSGGKDEMVNCPLSNFTEECVLLQMDVDEFWTAAQMKSILSLFESSPWIDMMKFRCNYFVGPDIIVSSKGGFGDLPEEWLRAWRWKPNMRFDSHEWPVLAGNKGKLLDKDYTEALGLVFNHYSWVLPKQAQYKQEFYRWPAGAEFWSKLQRNKVWPVDLKKFFYWAPDGSKADLWSNVYPNTRNPFLRLRYHM